MAGITIKDVARESGVSTATVSRVLSNKGYASDEIRERVLSVVKKLNYQPNAVARSLKNERTNTIGVIIPDISNSYFMTISKGIEDTLHQSGYNLIFCSGDENPKKEKEMLKVLLEKRVDAIVLATSGENEEMVTKIINSGLPVILVDRKINDQNHGLDLVVEDNIEAAFELTKTLILQGHERIGIVNGCLNVSTGLERYMGYKKAIAEFGIQENPELIFKGSFTQNDGIKAVDYFLNFTEKPTAILSFNNSMTFGVILQLTRRGIRIPKDVTVASYGEIEAAQLLKSPRIISVNQTPYEMGLKVGEILLTRLTNNVNGPIYEKFKPTLSIK
ncbi:LacI family transcriptional regulator [Bacillus sp. SA1-12]|uniref:LacI family DNA-binding transcriptional regulator n=1 Tax=Bacillus sp. SA1-12 TaxID=1455638 RepID=UPI000626F3EC|nr:LacI family DNA-binding transcriptional regulator [Bacillus sp. SA1-12]KKI90009.1 LacI family transcriptional regulator [Bacillus sp. SA1-12]